MVRRLALDMLRSPRALPASGAQLHEPVGRVRPRLSGFGPAGIAAGLARTTFRVLRRHGLCARGNLPSLMAVAPHLNFVMMASHVSPERHHTQRHLSNTVLYAC